MIFGAVILHSTHTLATDILNRPMKLLFNHAKHGDAFKKLEVRCTDCHSFAYKPKEAGPLSQPAEHSLIKPSSQVCHQCHVGKIELPRPNQCMICHSTTDTIKPKDHLLGWNVRHGKIAQLKRESCTQCHTTSSCNQCHLKQDTLNPHVHRPNFRLSHSVHARANPQSCVQCHKSPSFCVDCHSGARK